MYNEPFTQIQIFAPNESRSYKVLLVTNIFFKKANR